MSNTFENKGALATTIVVAASNSLNKGQANYVCDGTDDEIEINTAIAALSATGGQIILLEGTYVVNAQTVVSGTTYCAIMLTTGVSLTGQGAGTVIKIKNNWTASATDYAYIVYVGSANRIRLANLKIDGNKANQTTGRTYCFYGLTMSYSKISQCWLENAYAGDGIRLRGCNYNIIEHNHILNFGRDGILFASTSCTENIIVGNWIIGSSATGGGIEGDTQGHELNIIMSNYIEGCNDGIFLGGLSDYCIIIGNTCKSNVVNGIYVSGNHSIISSNILNSNGTGLWISTGHQNEATNNIFDLNTTSITDSGTATILKNNQGVAITFEKDYFKMKNTSGAQRLAGDVVILKSVAAGDEVTTTITVGDDKVFGMVAETIADNAYGLVQVLGKTTALKVDGTIDIAIGDFLCTYSAAGISQKAAAGDMAFAIALEAYTSDDSNGVIDALLIKPRKI